MFPHKLSRIANLHALIGSAAVCFCIAAWVPAEEPLKTSTAADELMQLEKVWNEAHLRGDAATLDQLWADDFELIVPIMTEMKKSEVLAFARSGRMKFQTYETSDIEVRTYGDMAIVTGTDEARSHASGTGNHGQLAIQQDLSTQKWTMAGRSFSSFGCTFDVEIF